MERFKIPSISTFQSRKVFHTYQRGAAEGAGEWLHRIKYSILPCEYGMFNDIMLIDKFLSGLSMDEFEKFAQNSEWSEEMLVMFVMENESLSQKPSNECVNFDLMNRPMPLQDIGVKDEVTDVRILCTIWNVPLIKYYSRTY